MARAAPCELDRRNSVLGRWIALSLVFLLDLRPCNLNGLGKKRRNGAEYIPRPVAIMADRLQNLHLLLRVPSFSRWPLDVRFFCEEVWQQWKHHTQNIDKIIRSGINIVLDLKQTSDAAEVDEGGLSTHEKGKRRRNAVGKGGVDGVDISYASFKSHFEKSKSLLASDQIIQCAVCSEQIARPGHTIVVCPYGKCTAASHMTCLARRFLSDEESQTSLLPTSGNCPECHISSRWVDLIKEMHLRARGEKEVAQLMKKSRMNNKLAMGSCSSAPGIELDASDVDEADDVQDDPLEEDWLPQEDEGDDLLSVASAASEASTPKKPPRKHLPTMIEDSEWDEEEVLG